MPPALCIVTQLTGQGLPLTLHPPVTEDQLATRAMGCGLGSLEVLKRAFGQVLGLSLIFHKKKGLEGRPSGSVG